VTLEPLLHASPVILLHIATVVPAALIGTFLIFVSHKGAPLHRVLGYIYLSLMTITAATTLWIHSLMPNGPFYGFSPVHLLVPLVLFGVYGALRAARAHQVSRHRRAMLSVYFGGILLAGGLTFLPGRIMHAIFFGG
jgi:uncharacterized membrane protein